MTQDRIENMDERMIVSAMAKHNFARIGWALFAIVGSLSVYAEALSVAVHLGAVSFSASDGIDWLNWLMSFLPVYVIALPLGYWVICKVPADEREGIPLGVKNFFLFLLMCFPLMYAGSIAGNLLAELLTGGRAENAILDYALDSHPLKLLVIVVLAPLFEEWFMRKQIIDRCVRYGEKTAILLSALAFALFHRNLYQIFYALWLGLVFAYVYVRTRRLRYSVLLHMIINFMGSVVAPLALSGLDEGLLDQLLSGTLDEAALMEALPSLSGLMLYSLAFIGLSIAGLIVLILHARKLVFKPAEEELPKKGRFRTVYLNAGMILFVLLCIADTIANLFL